MLFSVFKTYLLPYKPALITLLVLEFIQILGTLLLPSLNSRVVDDGVAQGDVGTVWRFGLIMLIVALLQITASVGAIATGAYVSMAAARDMRHDFFTQVMKFGHRETSAFGTSSLVTRSTNDIRQVQQFLTMGMSLMIMAPLMAVGGLIMALVQNISLSTVIVVTVIALAILMFFVVSRMIPSFRVMQERLDAMGKVLSQQLSGIRVIRAFVKEDHERAAFATTNENITAAQLTVGRYFTLLFPAVMLLVNAGTVAVVWFGAHQVEAGTTQVGVVMAFIQYLMLILMGIMMVSFISMMIPRAEVAAGRVIEVLDTKPDLDRSTGTVSVLPTPGLVEFDQVTFTYPGASAPVVEDISFRIEPGTTTAIIGSTGSGKTTLIQLLIRLLDPTSGDVRVGGVPVRDLSPQLLHAQFGYVPQKPHVFGKTIAENLLVANPQANAQDIAHALDIAQAAEFVDTFSDGVDHRVTQGGTNLSGGQRQRLAIAMAVVRQAPVLVFDDSFSALDTATDKAVRSRLAEQVDTTVLVVTQRVAAAKDAQQIVVLEQGRIAAVGSHTKLLETSAVYQEIVQSQDHHDESRPA